jgi:N-dimethylarginine dimethylaminohydrolase
MKVLMCPPTYFSIDYEINPWMDKNNIVDKKVAQRQWEGLVDTYKNLGVEVKTINPVENLPDMVFTANAGLVIDKKVILASFRYPERRPESTCFENWFVAEGYEVIKIDSDAYFEGQGEALWFGNKLMVGSGFRANLAGHRELRRYLGESLVSVKIVEPRFYHLDTCFLPLGHNVAAYYPPAFDPESRSKLIRLIPNLLEVSKEDALQFACNSVVVGRKIVMPAGALELPKKLQSLGYEVISLDISEFKKSGGGVRCLTLDLES